MENENLAQFQMVTGADPTKAQQYLQLSDNDLEAAVELFFSTGGVDLLNDAPPVPSTTHPAREQPRSETRTSREGGRETIIIDSDDEQEEAPPTVPSANAIEDDETMARRLQEEMYGGGGAGGGGLAGGYDTEGYRAPIARTTETLVGGPGTYDYDLNDPQDRHSAVLEQIRAREQARRAAVRGPRGIFNQQPGTSIWNDASGDHQARHNALAQATGGASQQSSKASQLAAMYRPPFEIMTQMDFQDARSEGKEQQKWLLVNVQDASIFDCQLLNRDLWKHEGIKETIKENFLFLQFAKDDPAGERYTQYYFRDRDNQDSYPHIAIVDPRTGEQVKVWSGPPSPKPMEFLMQLHEFLDRYSLDVKAKNPVARRKPEERKESQFERMSEEEQLEWALKQSAEGTAGGNVGKIVDPDDLTRSIEDMRKPATTNDGDADMTEAEDDVANGITSVFASISSTNSHTEPDASVPSTRIQFRHPNGRVVRRFAVADPVRRIYEWLKASPLEGKDGVAFELRTMGKDLIKSLDKTIEECGLKNATVMVEYIDS